LSKSRAANPSIDVLQGYLIFGDGESKLSLLDLASGQTIHLMPNTLVGTGRSSFFFLHKNFAKIFIEQGFYYMFL
jgi:hypothetical protein